MKEVRKAGALPRLLGTVASLDAVLSVCRDAKTRADIALQACETIDEALVAFEHAVDEVKRADPIGYARQVDDLAAMRASLREDALRFLALAKPETGSMVA